MINSFINQILWSEIIYFVHITKNLKDCELAQKCKCIGDDGELIAHVHL